MNVPNVPETVEDTAYRGIEAVSSLVQERNQLRLNYDRLRTDYTILRERLKQAEMRLNTSVTERDFYMRHSVELVSHLNNIQSLINNAVEEAQRSAHNPNMPTTPPEEPSVEDIEKLKDLVAKINAPEEKSNG